MGTVRPPPALAPPLPSKGLPCPPVLPPPLGSPCSSLTRPVSRPPEVGGSSWSPGRLLGLDYSFAWKRETSKIKTHVTGKWPKLNLNSATLGMFSYMNNN